MKAIFQGLSQSQCRTYSLVLSSAGIPHGTRERTDGWAIIIQETDSDKARNQIVLYLKENIPVQPFKMPVTSSYRGILSAMWIVLSLVVIHIAIINSSYQHLFIQSYGASSEKILNGQYYRAITALFLHSDYYHLIANAAGLLLFGTALIRMTGGGVGWLMALTCGVLGNYFNSCLYGRGHLSIGSSTALFGIIGILATCSIVPSIRRKGISMSVFLPFGGGVSFMALMGASPESDIAAHFFGFVSGTLIGVGYGVLLDKPVSGKYQTSISLISMGVVILCFVRGYAVK